MSYFFKMSRKSASRVLIFVMFFSLFAHVAGSIPVAAADDEILYDADDVDVYAYNFAAFPSNISDIDFSNHALPFLFTGVQQNFFGFHFSFSSPVLLSSLIGSKLIIDSQFSIVGNNVVSYNSSGDVCYRDSFAMSRTSSSSNGVSTYTFTFTALPRLVEDLLVKDIFVVFQNSVPTGKFIISAKANIPFVPYEPDPEPPTPATGEWQAFTQFIFGIFGTMGSIINNLLAAGGLSSIFFGFVFGIPIANFIIFLIEEIFDLEPYDPSSSWRREEHSLKELRPADYNNYAGDPPSNRIGF